MPERKTAIITGAASGIGLETARRFSQDPRYNPVYAADKNPAISAIFPQSKFPNVVPLQVDVGVSEELESMLQRSTSQSGRLDVLVNAAGVMYKGRPRAFWDKTKEFPKEWEEMENVNVWAPVISMVMASNIMRENGGGTIINITSAKYLFPDIHHTEYQIGKMRLSRATGRLARDYIRDKHVRLVDLQPGNTKTNIDRGAWTEESNSSEILTAESITSWWREKFGNDPRNVAEVIYQVAEGKINGTTIYVGLDTKIGRVLYLLTYPLAGDRLYSLFFAGSTIFYQLAKWINTLRNRSDESHAIK